MRSRIDLFTYRGCLLDRVTLATSCLNNPHLDEAGDEGKRGECKDEKGQLPTVDKANDESQANGSNALNYITDS